MSSFGFSYKKATQALNFLAKKNGGTIDKLKALKLIYFADKFHLRKYGRTISNDEYYAMNFGPVASGSKDILEASTFLDENERNYALQYLLPVPGSNDVKSIKISDNDELSETDLEALNYVWDTVGSLDAIKLCEMTHNYPEWKKFEEQLKSGFASRIKMELIDFFEDTDFEGEKFFELTPEERNEKIEYLKELEYIESLWN